MNQQPCYTCGRDRLQGKCSEVSGKMAASGDLETDGSPPLAEGGDSPLQWSGVTDAPSCQCDRDEISVTQTSGPSCGIVKVGEQYLTLRGQELCVTKDSPQCGSVFQMTNGQGTRGGQPVFLVTMDFRGGSGPPVYVCVPPQCREGELPILLEPFSSSPFIDQGERKQINPDARRLVFTEVLDPDRRKFHLRPLDFPRMCVCLSQDKLVGLDERHGDLIADFDFQLVGSQDSGFVTDSPTQRRPDRDPTLASGDSLTSSSSADSLSSRPACSPPWNSCRGEVLSEGDASSSEGGAAGAQTRRGRRKRNMEMCCTVS